MIWLNYFEAYHRVQNLSKTIKIAINAVRAKLIEPSREIKIEVTDLLSYYVDGYENTYTYKTGKWDGRSSMFDWKSETFPVGFINAVGRHLTAKGYEVAIIRKALPEPLGHVPKTLGGFSYTDKYDYQWETVEQLKKRGIMIARLSVGAGKTFAATLATVALGRPTLILTKRQPLMYQFWDRLKSCGLKAGIVGDNRFALNDDITVAMSQTLNKKLEAGDELSEVVREYLKKVEFIIGEEVHEVSDNSYWNIIQACPNAHYRLGLTATPFMRGDSESNMRLLGSFGEVGIDVSEEMLIGRGINAKPYFKFADYEPSSKLKFNSNYHKAVFEGITHNINRNKVIIDHTKEAVKRKIPTLILIQRKEHGNVLKAGLEAAGIKTAYIWGDSDSEEREKAIKKLADKKIDVLIGSTILDVGVDVPAIGFLVLAGGGKAEVAFRQRIGRGLRAKQNGFNGCFVLDLNDCHNIHLGNHMRERVGMIRATKGYAEGLLPSGVDFDWSLFK